MTSIRLLTILLLLTAACKKKDTILPIPTSKPAEQTEEKQTLPVVDLPQTDTERLKKSMQDVKDEVDDLIVKAKALGVKEDTLHWVDVHAKLLDADVQNYIANPDLPLYMSVRLRDATLSLHLGALSADPNARTILDEVQAANQKCLDLRAAVGEL